MNRRVMLAGAMSAAAAQGKVRDQFLGVWKLISYTRKTADGKIDYPYSEKPVGRITYDVAGRMSAQLMKPGRKSTLPSGVSFVLGRASTEEIAEAVGGFIAYFGTFDVDERAGEVVHHVEACLVPSWVGTDLRRKYQFSGNRLTLRAAVAGITVDLVWERQAA